MKAAEVYCVVGVVVVVVVAGVMWLSSLRVAARPKMEAPGRSNLFYKITLKKYRR